LERVLLAIESLTEQIRASDQELHWIATHNEECQRVMTVPGVGPTTAVRFVGALDEVSRFKTAHEVESYFGLTPGEQSSSDTTRRTGLTKAGSAAVRWLLVQAAWTALRTRPQDPMVVWAREMGERKKNKFIAVVALARKMAGVMFALLRDKTNYQPQLSSTARAEPRVVASGTEVTALARRARPSSRRKAQETKE
jgi:transposase